MPNLNSKTIIVVGASRGFGRAIAEQAAEDRKKVIAVARSADALAELTESHANIVADVADASDPTTSARLFARWKPDELVLAAGAQPVMRALRDYDWESFARPFETDTKMTFHWLRNALVLPMKAQGRIVVISSGAALFGSAMSGGYAPAKQAQRFIANYARQEALSAGLDLRLQVILPQLNPNTRLGAAAVNAYAAKAGEEPAEFVAKRFGEALTPSIAAQAVSSLLAGEKNERDEWMLTGKGLSPLPNS